MDLFSQVFVDLNFQGRLNSSGELFQAEVFYFIEILKEFGVRSLNLPGYTFCHLPTETEFSELSFWLKIRGEWTRLWIRQSAASVAVLLDHP